MGCLPCPGAAVPWSPCQFPSSFCWMVRIGSCNPQGKKSNFPSAVGTPGKHRALQQELANCGLPGFPRGSDGKEPTHNPCVRKIPGEGNGNLLQHSCLEDPTDWGAWRLHTVNRITKSQTWLSNYTFTFRASLPHGLAWLTRGSSGTPIESSLLAEEGFPSFPPRGVDSWHHIWSSRLPYTTSPLAPPQTEALLPWEVSWGLTGTTCEKASAQETPDPTLPRPGGHSLSILQPFFQLMDRGPGTCFSE